ncbi:hypothetical protein EHO60_15985 [Leptospira fletcheri]|uniref:Uncharacterized protein n=1 Tax=Leptospira fletcheri TaxID=2484981 RepID=A0A4R9G4S2_9LEPT|nr:hypothetical protein [Leptospira fletcheri]TGK06522.1 hypothetical protein EHO60_15985 [Leptospira fletcheri]
MRRIILTGKGRSTFFYKRRFELRSGIGERTFLFVKDLSQNVRERSVSVVRFLLSLLSFLFLLGTVGGRSETAEVFYNSDSLFFSSVYSELESRGFWSGLQDWTWTPAPYLFPDLVLYLFLRTLSSWAGFFPVQSAQLAYAVCQWAFLLFGWRLLFSVLSIGGSPRSTEKILSFGFLFAAFLLLSGRELFFFLPAFHGGIWSFLPWAWGIFFWNRNSPSLARSFSVLLSCFSGAVSDPLFVPTYFLPLIAENLYFIYGIPRDKNDSFPGKAARAIVSQIPVGVGLALSWFTLKALEKNKSIFFPFHYFSGKAQARLLQDPVGLVRGIVDTFLVLFERELPFFVLIFAGLAFASVLRRKKGIAVGTRDPEISVSVLLLGSCILVPLCLIVWGCAQGLIQPGEPVDRYFGGISSSCLAVSLLGILSLRKISSAIFSLIVLSSFCFCTNIVFSRGISFEYRPEWLVCLDEISAQEGWKRGIAGFWRSAQIRNLSREKLVSDPYESDLTVTVWQSTFRWYETGIPYSFVLLDGIGEDSVRDHFGKPERIFECGKHRIFGIDKNAGSASQKFLKRKQSEILLWKEFTGRANESSKRN